MFTLNEDTAFILGTPSLIAKNIAASLRLQGHEIEEDTAKEQAYVIHFFLLHWEKSGINWRKTAEEEIKPMIQTEEKKIILPN